MVYLDTCVVIYWVENHSVFAPRIKQRLLQSQVSQLAISPLVMAEALVLPFRQNNTALIQRYQAFFDNCIVLPLPETVYIQSARLRAEHPGLKTPDALHLAAAHHHGCVALWTVDDRLQKTQGNYVANVCLSG